MLYTHKYKDYRQQQKKMYKQQSNINIKNIEILF